MATVLGTVAFFYPFRLLPFAVVFLFIALIPLITAILSGPVLKEPVRGQTWIALGLGAVGVACLFPGGLHGVEAGHLVALCAVILGSISMVASRYIGRRDNNLLAQVFYPNLALMIVMIVLLPFVFAPMTYLDLGLAVFYAALLFGARWVLVAALRILPAYLVTPLMNLQFIWMVIIGRVIFSEIPATHTYLGRVCDCGGWRLAHLGPGAFDPERQTCACGIRRHSRRFSTILSKNDRKFAVCSRVKSTTVFCRCGKQTMAIFTDQTIAGNFDPGVPPPLPTTITVITMTIDDADDDGVIRADGGDQINGSNVTRVWDGDTVTIDGVVVTGVTFYTADGGRYFTPSDGSVLTDGGTVSATTFVTTSTQFPVGNFGPPCFVKGTEIAVPDGVKRVEDLRVGDLVETLDQGPQPIIWIGERTVEGTGPFAPVRISKGALGNTRDLYVSQQHRMVLANWRTQLFLGQEETLCAAKHLCNKTNIQLAPCDEVTYFHIMFATHQIVFAEGIPSESFLAGEYFCHASSMVNRELTALFPENRDELIGGLPARSVVKAHEAAISMLA